tara:strand:- start:685 stop:1515 length:831 start_codon:yes stop_codon:yes gene_type:complete
MQYISGDTLCNNIDATLYFEEKYYNEYVKKYNTNENILDYNNPIINDCPLIFIMRCGKGVDQFYKKVVPLLDKKFIIISHYCPLDSGTNKSLINHPLLIKWYGENMNIKHEKTCGIPLGLENLYWGKTNWEFIIKNSKNIKRNLLYLNFSLDTHSNRRNIMNILKNNGFSTNIKKKWNDYIVELSNYKFAISPRGKGVDCHRTWECLYLGVIPIIEKSVQMSFFEDLPILFVDNYECITEDYLNEMYEIFSKKKFNMDKLDVFYWKKIINEKLINN